MKRVNQIFIAVEKQIRVVSPQSKLYATWCRGCRAETELVTFAAAAEIICSDIERVIGQAAAGKIHLGIRPEAMLVCLNSVLAVNRVNSCQSSQLPN